MRNRKLGRKRWIIPPMIIFLMVTLAVIVITALLAPVIAPIDLGASDLTQRLKMPKFKDPTSPYLFGTDNLGRDVAIRLLYATRSTIMISFTGMIIATVTGTALGILSGLGGKWIDAVLSFFTDVRLSIPTTFIGIIFACILGAKPVTTILVMAITGWSSYCRLVRSQIFQLKNAKFIEASRSMGASGVRIVFEHILVNIASPTDRADHHGAGRIYSARKHLVFFGTWNRATRHLSWCDGQSGQRLYADTLVAGGTAQYYHSGSDLGYFSDRRLAERQIGS